MGCGIREVLRAGYGLKISGRDRDKLISIGGMRDSFEIVGGMRDFNRQQVAFSKFNKAGSG